MAKFSWFTLVYLQTIDGLLIFAILLVYSGLLGLLCILFRYVLFGQVSGLLIWCRGGLGPLRIQFFL